MQGLSFQFTLAIHQESAVYFDLEEEQANSIDYAFFFFITEIFVACLSGVCVWEEEQWTNIYVISEKQVNNGIYSDGNHKIIILSASNILNYWRVSGIYLWQHLSP